MIAEYILLGALVVATTVTAAVTILGCIMLGCLITARSGADSNGVLIFRWWRLTYEGKR